MKVCLGGTFDHFHKGHKKLISTAFTIAGDNGMVFIGITRGNILSKKKDVSSFNQRKQNVVQFITEKNYSQSYRIEPIFDKFGPAVTDDFDAIVVSSETYPTAKEINIRRIKKAKKPLEIIQIPLVLAHDKMPISSSRIRNKKISKEGKVLTKD
jgi:pantetheine-phosphate adenylyltransferase